MNSPVNNRQVIQNDSSHAINASPTLVLAALGIVYGDIGTSPLYALKVSFTLSGLAPTPVNIIGLISLFLWSLILVVCVKYFQFVMPIHNKGEGGILALASRCAMIGKQHKSLAAMLGIMGIALFVGDGIITPAISVLSAVEGLQIVVANSQPYIIPLALFIIVILFTFQYRGSGTLGHVFGYIMLVWFAVLALLGFIHIFQDLTILNALNPLLALQFLYANKLLGFFAIGGVILVLTGCEAIYADLGHFGKKTIQIGWYSIVFPSLILNYLGQGALVINNEAAIANPFFMMVSVQWAPYLVFLATIATIIASQAIISGLFSLTWQAIMLKYLPRLEIRHTSHALIGQVYAPLINKILMVLCLLLIINLKTSDNLAHAYGLNIAGTMLITTILWYLYTALNLKWSKLKRVIIFTPFIIIDCVFLTCSLGKLFEGAWFACLMSSIIYFIIQIWIKGNNALLHHKHQSHFNVSEYFKHHVPEKNIKIPGVAVFFSRISMTIPTSLAIHIRQNHYVHNKIILLTISTVPVPKIGTSSHFEAIELCDGVWQINAQYGFTQIPDVHRIMRWAIEQNIFMHQEPTWFYLSRRILVISKHSIIKTFEAYIFRFLSHFAISGTEFYKIPHSKVIEIGLHYKI